MSKAVEAHTYGGDFLGYAAKSSNSSAQSMTAFFQGHLTPASVLDVGCALGTWLRNWQAAGVTDIFGVDGDYVERSKVEIAPELFSAVDLNKPFHLQRQFDLVQSLEVAEHISPSGAAGFAASLAQHASKYILFSAAPPGQGGEHHVNEQPYEYWRQLFAAEGFDVFDCVRPHLSGRLDVSFWYRYNTFLYVRREHAAALPAGIRATGVPAGQALKDISPLPFRMRKLVVSALPYGTQQSLARLKARYFPSGKF